MGEIEVYTAEEVRDKLKLKNINTVYRMIDRGELKAKKVGRSWRITGENLREYLNNTD